MTLTRYGIREWGSGGIIASLLLIIAAIIAVDYSQLLGLLMAIVIVVTWLCIATFFRSPHRNIPENPEVIVSPADGVIKDIEIIDARYQGFPPGIDMIRIGIFLSVFDVHVNRVPADMVIEDKKYKPGKYLDARNFAASKENESMLIRGIAKVNGMRIPIGIRQISGAIARRIVCPVEPEMWLCKGQIYGMIKFGSRTELYLPVNKNVEINVNVGDRVYAGTSVMAKIIK